VITIITIEDTDEQLETQTEAAISRRSKKRISESGVHQ